MDMIGGSLGKKIPLAPNTQGDEFLLISHIVSRDDEITSGYFDMKQGMLLLNAQLLIL